MEQINSYIGLGLSTSNGSIPRKSHSCGGGKMVATASQFIYLDELAKTAAVNADKCAITDETRSLTYRELMDEISERWHALANAGLKQGDRVAIVAENSVSYIVSVFAVWAAGGTVATIFPSTTASEVVTTVQDADPVIVFTDKTTDPLLRGLLRADLPVVRIDEDFIVGNVAKDVMPTPETLIKPLKLICYSSGTTSRPKAIMLSGDALFNSAKTHGKVWGLNSDEVVITCLPMAWLFGLTTVTMSTLLAGGTVVSLRRSKPELIAQAIEKYKVTFLPAVATVLAKLAHFLETNENTWNLSSLRLVLSGGEPRNETAFDALKVFTGLPVHDTYCASEMFPLITYNPVSDPYPRTGSAGKLVPRSELRVVDKNGTDVNPGEIGEALSRGPGLMLGYWNDPILTQESLTDDGWYKTKDLVRVDEDGYVYVVGRLSDMIIRGGSNVSPAEVEAVLDEYPEIAKSAVVGLPDPLYGEEVVAAVQLKNGFILDPDAIKAFASERLPGYKVPTRYEVIPEVPQNATTLKVNRAEVKQLLTGRST